MPENCPFNEIPFRDIDACLDCRYYDKRGHRCYWYSPPKPLQEILTLSERVTWLEAGGEGHD